MTKTDQNQKRWKVKIPQEGEIWIVKFDKSKEFFSKPYRTCLVISNDTQNEFDENVVVAGPTTDDIENIEPFEILVEDIPEAGLNEPSEICCNYLHTVNKKLRLIDKKKNRNSQSGNNGKS